MPGDECLGSMRSMRWLGSCLRMLSVFLSGYEHNGASAQAATSNDNLHHECADHGEKVRTLVVGRACTENDFTLFGEVLGHDEARAL